MKKVTNVQLRGSGPTISRWESETAQTLTGRDRVPGDHYLNAKPTKLASNSAIH